MSLELRIRIDLRQRLTRANFKAAINETASAFVGRPSTLWSLVESGVITDADAADLLSLHRMLEEADALSRRQSALADQIELQHASINLCPPEQLQFALQKLEAIRSEFIDANIKSQFLSTQNYYLPEFFENYIPKVVVLRRKQAA